MKRVPRALDFIGSEIRCGLVQEASRFSCTSFALASSQAHSTTPAELSDAPLDTRLVQYCSHLRALCRQADTPFVLEQVKASVTGGL